MPRPSQNPERPSIIESPAATPGSAARGWPATHFLLLAGDDVDAFLELSRRFTDDLERALEGRAVTDPGALLPPVAAALGGFPEIEVELARSIGAHAAVDRPSVS